MNHDALRNPYPSVGKGTEVSYGGCQGWLEDATAQRSGCGLVAATGEETVWDCPETGVCTLSGDNVDGFVVTQWN